MSLVKTIKEVLAKAWGLENLDAVSDGVILCMVLVVGLIALLSVAALVISVMLSVRYIKYNHKQNSFGKTGEEIARSTLDRNGLNHIKVSKNGSFLFGNSYSHFFKKVRLRRLTWQKKSISSMAMAYQKSELAVMAKNRDKGMRTRIIMTPFIYFGPLAFLPMVLLGLLLDVLVFNGLVLPESNGVVTIVFCILGSGAYIISFVMSLLILKTEVKAQQMALEQMKADGSPDSEIEDCKRLFKLYNIEYVNNMIVAILEIVYRVFEIIAFVQGQSSSSSSK